MQVRTEPEGESQVVGRAQVMRRHQRVPTRDVAQEAGVGGAVCEPDAKRVVLQRDALRGGCRAVSKGGRGHRRVGRLGGEVGPQLL